jgi:hypothetical protein
MSSATASYSIPNMDALTLGSHFSLVIRVTGEQLPFTFMTSYGILWHLIADFSVFRC